MIVFRTMGIMVMMVFVLSLSGQKNSLSPCGTSPQKSEWLKNYQKNPDAFPTRSGEILWVPISVTLVGSDDGKGYLSERTLHESLCTLNDDFLETDIQFYLAVPIRYISNDSYYEHETILQGAQMMFDNNYPDMINTYIVNDAAGNCGYNLPYAGIALSKGCSSSSDHTWAHEIGHNLDLPHPFLGWEGGVSHNGSISHDFADPAPEIVTYDYTFFQDTLILDTLIIDTSYVEKMDGSNCHFAADGFCDTKPDYIAQRWQCDANGNNFLEQTDPNGVKFYSDGSNFMSYALDNCTNSFTSEQINAMRANLLDEKSSYLGNENVLEEVADTEVEVISPSYLEDLYFLDAYIEWEPVENATMYSIQVSLRENYALTVFDTIVAQPYITLPALRFPNDEHYFRIKALNEYDFCSEFIAFGAFQAIDQETSVFENQLSMITVFPTKLKTGQYITIKNKESHTYEYKLVDIDGQVIYQSDVLNSSMRHIETSNLSNGLYILSLIKENVVVSHKLIIAE